MSDRHVDHACEALASSNLLFYFFFLMIRRPPRSTLFPTRRSSDLGRPPHQRRVPGRIRRRQQQQRSEEHTSELQSHVNLVCRLLLEKKKKTYKQQTPIPSESNAKRPIKAIQI